MGNSRRVEESVQKDEEWNKVRVSNTTTATWFDYSPGCTETLSGTGSGGISV